MTTLQQERDLFERALYLFKTDQFKGICVSCGSTVENVTPDGGEACVCPVCGSQAVYSTKQLAMTLGS